MIPRVAVIVGTRPEAIKLAPIVLQGLQRPRAMAVEIINTGQHRDLLVDMLDWFGLTPAHELNLMRVDQSLSELTSRALVGLENLYAAHRPDLVIVQGDTTSAFVGALAAFHRRVPVAHIEAGLRTHDRYSPFPEEIYRQLISRLATLHFSPTTQARANLLSEGIPEEDVFVTGNTAIDALLWTADRVAGQIASTAGKSRGDNVNGDPTILVTMHRRENVGEPTREVCAALLDLLELHARLRVEIPLHPNPKIGAIVVPMLGGHPRINLCAPLAYPDFVAAMLRASFILSDSGGVQEEAPSLGKRVLILRDQTERPEALGQGGNRLVGTSRHAIVAAANELLSRGRNNECTDGPAIKTSLILANPYGDGRAAQRILDQIEAWWHNRPTTR